MSLVVAPHPSGRAPFLVPASEGSRGRSGEPADADETAEGGCYPVVVVVVDDVVVVPPWSWCSPWPWSASLSSSLPVVVVVDVLNALRSTERTVSVDDVVVPFALAHPPTVARTVWPAPPIVTTSVEPGAIEPLCSDFVTVMVSVCGATVPEMCW